MKWLIFLVSGAFGLAGVSTPAVAVIPGQRVVEFSYKTAPLDCVEESGFTCIDPGAIFLIPGDQLTANFVIDESLFGAALNGQTVTIETSDTEWIIDGASQFDPPDWLLSYDNGIDFPGENFSLITLVIDANLNISDWNFLILGDPDTYSSSLTEGDRYAYVGTIVGAEEDQVFTSGGVAGTWTTTVVPLPATLPLLVGGLAFLFGMRVRRRARDQS